MQHIHQRKSIPLYPWMDNPDELEKVGTFLRKYPVLIEKDGYAVAQAEHTIIVKEDGCEVITA